MPVNTLLRLRLSTAQKAPPNCSPIYRCVFLSRDTWRLWIEVDLKLNYPRFYANYMLDQGLLNLIKIHILKTATISQFELKLLIQGNTRVCSSTLDASRHTPRPPREEDSIGESNVSLDINFQHSLAA